jgi:hypothetical protein
MPAGSRLAFKHRLAHSRKKLGSFRNERRRQFSALLLRRLPKAHAWSATVLVDELDARFLECPAKG